MTPITCSILTYNEAGRIRTALTHATQWADEVLILDKHSTDETVAIARLFDKVRVVDVGFSPQGFEDYIANYQFGAHDWTWVFTPGEVPTRGVIEAARRLITDAVDVVLIAHKCYSFGIHHPASPWGWSYQPRLFHRGRAKIQNQVHAAVLFEQNRVAVVPDQERNHVLHQTHATASAFIRTHADYMQAENLHGDPVALVNRALRTAVACDAQFGAHPELQMQHLAWRIYWYGVALHALERQFNRDVPMEYEDRATSELVKQWTASAI